MSWYDARRAERDAELAMKACRLKDPHERHEGECGCPCTACRPAPVVAAVPADPNEED